MSDEILTRVLDAKDRADTAYHLCERIQRLRDSIQHCSYANAKVSFPDPGAQSRVEVKADIDDEVRGALIAWLNRNIARLEQEARDLLDGKETK